MFGLIHPRHISEKIAECVQSLRRQAPAAKMIGEFAVKHAAKEANKKISGLSPSPPSRPQSAPQPPES